MPLNGAGPRKGKKDGTKAVDVGGRGDLRKITHGLLGGHISRRAQNGPDSGQSGVDTGALGQSEIGDVRMSLFVEQDIRRFQVAVQNAARWAWCTLPAISTSNCTTARGSLARRGYCFGKVASCE